MSRSFYLGTDAELYTGGQNFATKVNATPAVYGISTEMSLSLNSAMLAYVDAYNLATNPETRTKGKVAVKNACKGVFRGVIGDCAKIIDGQPSVTDAMKIEL